MQTNRSWLSRRLVLARVVAALPSVALAATSWAPSGPEGGGFQNVLAIKPDGSGLMISGADVSGFQRSTDYGVSWTPVNVGTPTSGASKIATIIFSNDPAQPNTVYAGYGWQGDTGGFMVSTDAGLTWTTRSSVPKFAGTGLGQPNAYNAPDSPRSTGTLLALDEGGATKYIYAGTTHDGMMRSTDGGTTWTTMGLSGRFIRGIAIDPAAPWVIYVACYGDRIWKTTTARNVTGTGTSGWTQLGTAPNKPEELLLIGSTLYAAGVDDSVGGGLWKTTDAGTTWSRVGASALATSSTWMSLAGYANGGSNVLYAGCLTPAQDGTTGYYKSVVKSTDSGSTWADVTKAVDIHNEVGGPGGRPWWYANYISGKSLLGGQNGDIAMIQIDPLDHAKVFLSGRGGVWGSTDATASTIDWYPKVAGLSVSVNDGVATDPGHPERLYIADVDFTFLYSTDHGASVTMNRPTGNRGWSLCVDGVNSQVYLGVGGKDTNDGGAIYSNPDPTNVSNVWTNEGSPGTGKRPHGIVVGRNASSSRVILAGIEASGLWRKVGTGSWTQVSTTISPDGGEHTSLTWVQGSAYVYCFDQGTGVWRSSDYGATWTQIWTHASTADRTGFVVADPAQVGRIYLSASDGVYRATNAHTSGTISPTNISGPTNPGPMAFGNGVLHVCDLFAATHNAGLCEWLNPSTSSVFSNIADLSIYPGMACWPNQLAVSSDDHLYAAFDGDGVISGAPWISDDVGAVGVAGSTQVNYSTGVFTVNGSGANVFGTADAFQFMDRLLSGNGQVVAHVTSVENTNQWAKAGVMIRETLTAGSRHAFIDMTPVNGIEFLWRDTTGGTTQQTINSGVSAPYWLKIARKGSTFTASRSSDGTTWTDVGTATITMATDVYIGLAVNAHDNTTLCTGVFDNVVVTPLP